MSPPVSGPRVQTLPLPLPRRAREEPPPPCPDSVEVCDRHTEARKSELAGTQPRPSIGQRMAEGGQASLNDRTQAHLDSIEATGVGAYYGTQSIFGMSTPAEQKDLLESFQTPGTTAAMPKPSDCLTWSMEHLGAAYANAGMSKRWHQIEQIVKANHGLGTVLAKELQKDGWKGLYFNPDTKHPYERDDAEGRKNAREHVFTADQAGRSHSYYGLRVDGMITNYRPTPDKGTELDERGTSKLDQVPFFFGVTRGGMHTFVGQEGRVSEFHWDREPMSKSAIQEQKLNRYAWNSGLILVPPGTWR